MNQRDNKSDDELLLLLLVGGAKKRRRRREKEGSGLGQGGSQFPSTPRRWRKMNRVRRSLPSADYFAFLPRRWEKWRDRGMRSFVPGLGFVSPRNRAPDIIASLEIPPSTDLTSGSEFYSYLTILYWLVSFITMLLQGSRGREDWWRSSGTYFSREGGRDANTAGVIWIFYGGDDRRKIEVGLLDNKLIRSCCESYEIVNCYINLVIYSLSLQPNLFNIEL